ncbi:hypothetical protein KXV81_006167 [Aspergillus fumigatus]|uniref:Uncharacterized protein n=1 Tax=Aspergillus fumigatus (strain CBS 144.89 / FGSC A1163 / CEA10) TaxID=451804 RepID=B0XT43_ASPFC|nr:conserved hypothetical protein [Aspergillus fumigatus A1163]KAH1386386.1 hypothetical protein KXX10_003963 [Aspergillus fumigatus]KAH1406156.1 hypothetical protein KXX51_008321 [Aspergillus fumigatus]KAH1432521.1 hypothetical protein KXX32_002203 [Aspergillus fumigatus]KAH1456211.1 hypothetical protein KXX53_006302 [Aspergillus fumigatus]
MGAPATNSETIHVVNKADNRQHAVVNLDSSLDEELPVSALRARPILLGLTSNNLSYARGGDLLHWWETYPVPHTAPPPYNDQASWGIVPAWGYATVTESSVPGIAPDSVIWGYWPTSTSPTLLRLEPSDLQGHWVEVSSHRQQLMPIYNRYEQILPENEEPDEMAWGALLRGVWIAGYLLSEYVFSPDPRARVPVHPLGAASKLPWSAGDADLSSAVVVVLAASTKTARSILWCLFNRPRESGPLGLVQVTSSPAALQKVASKKGWGDVSKSLAYTEIHQATRWIEGRQPSKVVIIDCGARDHVLSQLYKSLQVSALQPCKTVIIQLGSQQKVYTTGEIQTARADMQSMGKIQFNASGVQDTLIDRDGAATYFGKISRSWKVWLADRDSAIPDMHLVRGQGIAGENGIYGGWERLTHGAVRPEEGLVYAL